MSFFWDLTNDYIHTFQEKKSWLNGNLSYTILTNFSMKYLVVCKVYTDVGGMK